MKKIIIGVVALSLILSIGIVSAANSNGQPFQALWDAIDNLQDQITNISLTPGPKGDKGDTGEQGPPGESGELTPGLLPPPAFDSGWIILADHSTVIDVPHNVGGDIDDYFIYASYRRPNGSQMSHQTAADKIWWEDVEPNNIQIVTNGDVSNLFDAARIRIWTI